MEKMQPMSSPLGGNNKNNDSSDAGNDANNNNNNGTRKLPDHLDMGRLDRKLQSPLLDRKLPLDPLDTHLGEEREDLDNKAAEELNIPTHKKPRIGEESILDGLKIFTPPAIRDYNTLVNFMNNHVVELRFTRKHTKLGFKDTRRMVCTSNWKFLSSVFTRMLFNWNTPKTRRGQSWYKQRNLIIVWDLMVSNFRIIPVTDIRFISAYKCTSLMEKGRFILFYRKNIRKLTPMQEKKYFNA